MTPLTERAKSQGVARGGSRAQENLGEQAARLRKATKLATTLAPMLEKVIELKDLDQAPSELAATLDEQVWKLAADAADVNAPSPKTIAIVIDMLREREQAVERVQQIQG
jgi:hypothetical protein